MELRAVLRLHSVDIGCPFVGAVGGCATSIYVPKGIRCLIIR